MARKHKRAEAIDDHRRKGMTCSRTGCDIKPRWWIDGDAYCQIHAGSEALFCLMAEPCERLSGWGEK